MVNIPSYVGLHDKYVLFTHFYLMKGKNRQLVCISSKQRIFWHWTHNFSVNKLSKTLHSVKMNYQGFSNGGKGWWGSEILLGDFFTIWQEPEEEWFYNSNLFQR